MVDLQALALHLAATSAGSPPLDLGLAMRLSVDRYVKDFWIETTWQLNKLLATQTDARAVAFFNTLVSKDPEAASRVRILPSHRIMYVPIFKAASSRIERTLGQLVGQTSWSLNRHWGRIRRPVKVKRVDIRQFHRLATSPETLKFSFVRNPYSRAVSCWANKFEGKPLIGRKAFAKRRVIDIYLDANRELGLGLPEGNISLSFSDFVTYTAATAGLNLDGHVRAQAATLDLPGLPLDFIGRIETFDQDIVRVLDHAGADDKIRREVQTPIKKTRSMNYSDLYTTELADRVYRTYEADFDHFGYPRTVP